MACWLAALGARTPVPPSLRCPRASNAGVGEDKPREGAHGDRSGPIGLGRENLALWRFFALWKIVESRRRSCERASRLAGERDEATVADEVMATV